MRFRVQAMKTLRELEVLFDEELRVMLAKITGKMCDNCGCASCDCEIVGIGSGSPNYPQSLDACHAVEAKLTDDQHDDFRSYLADLTPSNKAEQSERMREAERLWISAKARQRSVALILTLQKP